MSTGYVILTVRNLGRPRFLRRWYAGLAGYFWIPCPVCGEMFSGHEMGDVSIPIGDNKTKIACRRHVYGGPL